MSAKPPAYACRQRELHRLARTADEKMHPQTVKIAALARYVAPEGFPVLLEGVDPAAADADVVANRNGQRIHHVVSLGAPACAIALLEHFGQKREQSLPKRGFDAVRPPVESAL